MADRHRGVRAGALLREHRRQRQPDQPRAPQNHHMLARRIVAAAHQQLLDGRAASPAETARAPAICAPDSPDADRSTSFSGEIRSSSPSACTPSGSGSWTMIPCMSGLALSASICSADARLDLRRIALRGNARDLHADARLRARPAPCPAHTRPRPGCRPPAARPSRGIKPSASIRCVCSPSEPRIPAAICAPSMICAAISPAYAHPPIHAANPLALSLQFIPPPCQWGGRERAATMFGVVFFLGVRGDSGGVPIWSGCSALFGFVQLCSDLFRVCSGWTVAPVVRSWLEGGEVGIGSHFRSSRGMVARLGESWGAAWFLPAQE